MCDSDLFDAVAQKTGEDFHEIRHRDFILTGPNEAGAATQLLNQRAAD